jgi:ferric-chelate reductase
LVWTARQTAFLHEVASRELWPALGREDFQASFYATRASEVPLSSELAGLGCGISTGRPHIQSLIMSRACDASAAGSTLAILVCGPAGMADEARAATHLAMRQGYRSIKYVEESFAW